MLQTSEAEPDWRSLVTDGDMGKATAVHAPAGEHAGGSGGLATAAAELEAHFQKAVADLSYISRKMDTEFATHYDEAGHSQLNPRRLTLRLARVRLEMEQLQEAGAVVAVEREAMMQSLGAVMRRNNEAVAGLENLAGLSVQAPEGSDMAAVQRGMASTPVGAAAAAAAAAEEDALEEVKKENTRRSRKIFASVTKEELAGVSDLVKKRAKLAEVNQVYEAIFQHFKKRKAPPLSLADLGKLGLTVTGQTGEAKLQILRTLKIIVVDKKTGITLA